MNQPVLLLERHFLQKLHVDWRTPASKSAGKVAATSCDFDYDVGTHRTDKQRRMLTLRIRAQELDEQNKPIGHLVECEIVGLFQLTDSTPAGKEEATLRINGFSILYGILRGILAMTTGVFPGGGFSLPSVMPQDIVADVESKKAGKTADSGSGNAPSAPPAKSKSDKAG